MHYPDRRGRYRSALPGQVPAGNARGDNPVPAPEPKANLAKRGLAPGEHFRETTSLTKPESVPTQVDSAVPLQVNDAKVPETPKSASPTAPTPAIIGSVLARDGV